MWSLAFQSLGTLKRFYADTPLFCVLTRFQSPRFRLPVLQRATRESLGLCTLPSTSSSLGIHQHYPLLTSAFSSTQGSMPVIYYSDTLFGGYVLARLPLPKCPLCGSKIGCPNPRRSSSSSTPTHPRVGLPHMRTFWKAWVQGLHEWDEQWWDNLVAHV